MKMRKYGTRMAGNEHDFESIILNYVKHIDKDADFTYLEIGVDGGYTLKCVTDIVKEIRQYNNYFCAIDIVDINQSIWTEMFGKINKIFGRLINLTASMPNFIICECNLILNNGWNKDIDICFIDGCHGYECVKNNFLNVDKFIKKGGYVIFHDAGEPEQNSDYQPHCGENINVRQAILDLGLLNNHSRWEFVKETDGTRKFGADGNSCIIVRKR